MNKNTHEAFHASLMEAATNPRNKDSLLRIREACDFLESSRARITLTSVGRYCESKWEGPKAQSIRNAKDTLFAYVQARQSAQVLPSAATKGDFEVQIQDETIRAYVALLKIERDEAVRARNRVIEGLRQIPGVPIDELLATGFKQASRDAQDSVVPKSGDLPKALRSAVTKLLSPEVLATVGLELFKTRIRHMETNQVLLEKTEVEALITLLEEGRLVGADFKTIPAK